MHSRVWCRKSSALFQDFLLPSAVWRVRGRFQNRTQPRYTNQTPVETLSEIGDCDSWFAILRACHRAQKPQKPGNSKNYEKIRNPTPRVVPRKYRNNTKLVAFGPCWGIFFSYFRGPTGGVDLVFLSYFSYFRDLVVLSSVAGPQDCDSWWSQALSKSTFCFK